MHNPKANIVIFFDISNYLSTFGVVMRNIYNILVAWLLLCSVAGCSAMYDEQMPSYEKTTLVRVGEDAPDFTVKTIDGNYVTLSQFQGRVVLLVFFASWCPDCHKQLDALEAITGDFDSSKFAILAVSRGEKEEVVREFINSRGYTFQVGVDSDNKAYSLFATQYVPRCYVIDTLGRIVALSAEYNAEEFGVLCNVISSLMQ